MKIRRARLIREALGLSLESVSRGSSSISVAHLAGFETMRFGMGIDKLRELSAYYASVKEGDDTVADLDCSINALTDEVEVEEQRPRAEAGT